MSNPLVAVDSLQISYRSRFGTVPALRNVNLSVDEGESTAVIGESGSGKSTLGRALMGLLPQKRATVVAGSIVISGTRVDGMAASHRAWRDIRGNTVAMVFQDAVSSLNPVMRIGDQIAEAVNAHGSGRYGRERVEELLHMVSLPATVFGSYPHQLSGGMCQRVMIAVALASEPRLLIADEPTSALDVTTQAEIVKLLRRLQSELGMALMFITHDLAVASNISTSVNVMYAGEVVERGPIKTVLTAPRHPYTAGLVASSRVVRDDDGRFVMIPGASPRRAADLAGCAFAARCSHADHVCESSHPDLVVSGPSALRCWRPL